MANPAVEPPAESADDAELDSGRMPFLAHLIELKNRLRNAAIAFAIAFFACFFFASKIYDWIRLPLDLTWTRVLGGDSIMIHTGITQPFWVDMSVALWAGIFLSSPFIFYQIWRFIAPGLYKREQRTGLIFAIVSAVFFIIGALFCYYFVLERLFEFMLGYADKRTQFMLDKMQFLDLTRNMMLAFGAVFELPILIFFLAAAGLVTHRSLWKFNRWFVVLAFIIGAILTPGPDVVSQLMMALPLIILYNLSIIVAWIVVRRKERKRAAESGDDPPDDPPPGARP